MKKKKEAIELKPPAGQMGLFNEKIKKPNPNNIKKDYTTVSTRDLGFYSWKGNVNETYIKVLADELVRYVMEERDEDDCRPLNVTEFFFKRGIYRDSIKHWRIKYPEFDRVYTEVLTFIGARRETGALRNKLNPVVMMKTAHRYDSDWDLINQYHCDLKKDENASNQEIKVIVEQVPSSDEVPLLEKE